MAVRYEVNDGNAPYPSMYGTHPWIGTGPFTVVAWARQTNVSTYSNWKSVVTIGNGSVEFDLLAGTSGNGNGMVYYWNTILYSGFYPENDLFGWNHYVWRRGWDGAIMMYMNGVPSTIIRDGSAGSIGSGLLQIGRWQASQPFHGDLAEVAMWGYPLDQTQITELAKGATPGQIAGETAWLYKPMHTKTGEYAIGTGITQDELSVDVSSMLTVVEHPRQVLEYQRKYPKNRIVYSRPPSLLYPGGI